MTDPPRPDGEALDVTTPAQFKALAHPLRQRLLFRLGQEAATISQLASGLDARKGTVAHHLNVLRQAGMVTVTGTRQVRGGTEQYYERTSRRIVVAGQDRPSAVALLGAVADEVDSATSTPLLHLRHLRLTPAQAEKLAATLNDLVADTADAGADADAPRYGLLVGLYQQGDPPSPPP